MNINEFRYVIYVQEATKTKGEFGAETIVYTTVQTLKAAIKSSSGTKTMNADELYTTNTIVFETYFRDITEDMLIEFVGKKYRITQIIEIGFRAGMQIICEKINE